MSQLLPAAARRAAAAAPKPYYVVSRVLELVPAVIARPSIHRLVSAMTLPTHVPRSAPSKSRRYGANSTKKRCGLFASAGGAALMFLFIFRGGRQRRHESPLDHILEPAVVVPIIRLRSGLEMPAVGYGTCCRSSAKGEAIYKSTKFFLQKGGRLIDTAMAYRNHAEIGRAVRDSGVKRKDIWITSKIAPGKVKNYDDCLSATDRILKELGVDYLDMLLIHTPKLGKEPTVELWKCLIEEKRLGQVKVIGVSNFNQGEIEDIADATGGEMPEANEIQQHPWSTESWKQLARWQSESNIATIAYTSLGGSRFHRSETGNTDWPPVVTELAKKYGATEAQILLKWALQRGIAVIPGSGSEKHIEENLQLPKIEMLNSELVDIESADPPVEWWDLKRGPQKYTDGEAHLPWTKRKNG